MMDTATIVGKLLPLLFNMMGPIGLIPVFAAVTARMDVPTRKAVALRTVLFAGAGVLIAVLIGEVILQSWGISNASLVVAAGVILALTAIRSILMTTPAPIVPEGDPDPKAIAIRPLAFPTIVSPQGIGVVIIFTASLIGGPQKATVLVVAGAMIALDYVAMRFAHVFMARIGMVPLMVLGAVFGVLQVALGVEMILSGLSLAAG